MLIDLPKKMPIDCGIKKIHFFNVMNLLLCTHNLEAFQEF